MLEDELAAAPPRLIDPVPTALLASSAKERGPMIGAWLTRPLHLLWIAALPQALLLLLNARAWHLVSGEMNAGQRTVCAFILAFQLILIGGSIALAITLRVRREPLALAWNWPLLGASIGYLAYVTAKLTGWELIPATVPAWIMSSGDLLYYQFVLTMPLVFYAGVRLACFKSRRGVLSDVGWTVAIVAALMGVAYLLMVMRAPDWLSRALITAWLVASTLLVLGGLLRLLATGYSSVRGRGTAPMAGLIGMVGIAAPLAGLLLNQTIPFPIDFQSWEVYALTIVNGTVLLLPAHRNPWVHRSVWLAQCALFSFSLYFFLVFLPLLPLSLPAMLFFGAGFLILAPTALFVVHFQRLVDGYEAEVRDGGRRWVPATLGVLAGLFLPAVYLGGALVDRVVLREALDYAYTPSYRADAAGFRGSPSRVGRSLEHLRDFKAGLNLPFLTDLYKAVVFGGLVLPDDKMQHLHRVFLGADLPPVKEGRNSFLGEMQAGRSQPRRREVVPQFQPPPASAVTLTNVERATAVEGLCERTRLTLRMQNTGADPAEFVTEVHLPEAVRVTGFWLYIGDERVPGRLFERKTAMWVYHRIRDAEVRRDPGMLVYTDPQTVQLRVYPFEGHQQRTAELELLYPTALAPTVQVGDRPLVLGQAPDAGGRGAVIITPAPGEGTAVTLTPASLAKLPALTRRPYLHFVLDRSAGSDADAAALRRAMDAAAAQFPDAREGLLTTANFECREPFGTEPMPLPKLRAALANLSMPSRGGFLQERALKRGLLIARDRLAKADSADDPALGRYPILVVVRGARTEPLSDGEELGGGGGGGGLAAFAKAGSSESGAYYLSKVGGPLESVPFGPNSVSPRPVTLLRYGSETAAVSSVVEQPQTVRFAASNPSELSVFVPSAHSFQRVADLATEMPPALTLVPADASYTQASSVFLRYRALVENPSEGNLGLSQLAALSRKAGTLVGATSFIVVENSVQWRILEQKEKGKLSNSVALEIEEVPEPGTYVLLTVGGALAWLILRRRHIGLTRSN